VGSCQLSKACLQVADEKMEFKYGRYLQMYWQPERGVALQLGKWVRVLKLAIKICML
jgi:hypothetical protein